MGWGGWSPDCGINQLERKDNWGEFKNFLPTTKDIVTFGLGMHAASKIADSITGYSSSHSSWDDDDEY